MKRSVLLQKVFLVVIVALVLAALCTGAVYNVISHTLFAGIKSAELLPKAHVLSQLLAQEGDSEKAGAMLSFMRSHEELLGGYFVITDADGQMMIGNDDIDAEIFSSMDNIVARVLKGEEVSIPMDTVKFDAMLDDLIKNSKFQKKEVKEAIVDMGNSF